MRVCRPPESSLSSSGRGLLRYGETGAPCVADNLEFFALVVSSSELSYVNTCRVAGGLRAALLGALPAAADELKGRPVAEVLAAALLAEGAPAEVALPLVAVCCCCCFCRC